MTLSAEESPVTAILAETSPRLRANTAALTLRIWHHLACDDAHRLLFEPFRTEGRPFPLIEAILISAMQPDAPFTLRLDGRQIRSGQASLIEAFGLALADMFGANETAMHGAWQAVLDRLLTRIADRGERRIA